MSAEHDRLCSLANGCTCHWIKPPRACDECNCTCEIVEAARQDERDKYTPPWLDEQFFLGYQKGRLDAARAIDKFFERTDKADENTRRTLRRTALGSRSDQPLSKDGR